MSPCCFFFFFFSAISIWTVNKKKPVSTVKKAHGSHGNGGLEQPNWVSSVAALHNSDTVASGASGAHTHTHNKHQLSLTGNKPSALKSTAAHQLSFALLSHTRTQTHDYPQVQYYHHNLSSFHFDLVHKALRLLYFHTRLLSKHLITINIVVPPQALIIQQCSCGSVGRDSEAWSRSSASLW